MMGDARPNQKVWDELIKRLSVLNIVVNRRYFKPSITELSAYNKLVGMVHNMKKKQNKKEEENQEEKKSLDGMVKVVDEGMTRVSSNNDRV